MKTYVLAVAAVLTLATPALAGEFYLAQDPESKKCKIVETKPDGTTKIQVGEVYATREEAKAAKQALAECVKKQQ